MAPRAAAVLLALTATPSAATPAASTVCVYNAAAFVLKWRLRAVNAAGESPETKSYPVGQVKCMPATAAGGNVTAGAAVVPVVKAVWGKELQGDEPVLYEPINASQVTYVCRGTTLSFSCKQQPMPPTAANVSRAVGEFLLGFTEGLGADIGFTECIEDVNKTYQDVVGIVGFFESGINHKTVVAIEKAFQLVGGMLKDVATAIVACVKDAEQFAAKVKDLAAALSGDVLSIVKVVVEDAVHIWRERSELTADCKACTADWRAADYKGSGAAVGDIVGIILDGL